MTVQERSIVDERLIEDTVPAELEKRRDVADLILRLSVLRRNQSIFGEKHPQFQKILVDIKSLEDQLSAILSAGKPPSPPIDGAKKSEALPRKESPTTSESAMAKPIERKLALGLTRELSGRTSTRPSPRTLLTSSDFTYLGRFFFPGSITGEFHFGLGHFAAKYVGGNLRFYSKGNAGGGNQTYSFENPGYDNTASIITSYSNDQLFGSPSKLLIADKGDNVEYCSFWFDAEGVLWTTYSTEYEGTNHNPCFVASELSDAPGVGTAKAYGPWRCTLHSGMSAGCLSAVPTWFRNAYDFDPVINVSGMRVQNGSSSWGMSIQSITLPALGATPDPVSNQAVHSIISRLLAHHPITNKEPRIANYDVCDGYTAAAPFRASQEWGGNANGPLDWVDQAIWIDNGKKHGIVGLGQWCDAIPGVTYPNGDVRPHNWYGPDTCAHGHVATPLYQGTGPACSSVVDMLFISDPMEAVAVKNGEKAATSNNIASSTNMNRLRNYPFSSKRETLDKVGGMFFDTKTGLLYVSVKLSYQNAIGHAVPFMMVFQIAD